MSSPAFGQPKGLPFTAQESGSESLAPSQAPPSSSGVTATGEKADDGLRLEEAEALAELVRDEVAQRHVVDDHHEPDRRRGLLSRRRHGDVAKDHRDLALEVDAPGFGRHRDRFARPEERVGAALVHQRIGPERRRHLGAPGPADELDVVHIGRAVGPLIGARQRRGAVVLVEAERGHRADLELARQIGEARAVALPVVEGRLQRRRDDEGVGRPRQVPGDDDEPAVAAVPEAGEFHDALMTLHASFGPD